MQFYPAFYVSNILLSTQLSSTFSLFSYLMWKTYNTTGNIADLYSLIMMPLDCWSEDKTILPER